MRLEMKRPSIRDNFYGVPSCHACNSSPPANYGTEIMEAQNGLTPRVVAAISGVQALGISAGCRLPNEEGLPYPPWFLQAVPPNWKTSSADNWWSCFAAPKEMEGFRPPLGVPGQRKGLREINCHWLCRHRFPL
jgi:hypothetical protein